jgi:GntR family transcriptional regulator
MSDKAQPLQLTLQKGGAVSIHQQLVTQLSLLIAGGQLPAGSRLPSVRALAQRLDVHYNTVSAVYQELGTLGMVETKRGSGVRVARILTPGVTSLDRAELGRSVRLFVQQARSRGFGLEEIQQALLRIWDELEAQATQPITFVDIHPDIIPLFVAELTQQLGLPVRGVELTKLSTEDIGQTPFFLVSRYHYQALRQQLGEEAPVVVVDVGTGQHELSLIKSLPPGSLVTIISHSSIVLQMGESLIQGLGGRDLLVRTLLYDEGMEEIFNAIRYARMVVADFLCAQELAGHISKPIHTLRVLPDAEIEKIRAQLPQKEA